MKTLILTDSSADLPRSYVADNNIPFVSLTFHFKGKEIPDDFGVTLSYDEFYQAVREGELPTTSQVNVHTFSEIFQKYVNDNVAVIYIGFSSGLSGSLASAQIAQKAIKEKNPAADITVIDSKSASLGQGLLVYHACQMLKNGSPKEEIIDWVENNKLRMNHWFTVDSLDHLKRGGRISAASAMVGGILNIKPVLTVNNEGKLVPFAKVQGRKKSIKMLAEMLAERIVRPEEQVIGITHAGCLQEAEFLKDILTQEYKFQDIIINHIGAVIGSHTGAGALALFFFGEKR